ncbi:protein RICE SALT SENSITIVE 3 [Nicotiana tomentosiformis]|uniref:protein RICE SALT SENSITIVE 3 n=1 Tax=Nicotiana tomentosiformis TaxID=4098 RepID=UPI00051CA52D|nr:protein RICE SALT SENSITIVE 3 [Nicotiana tomentosiformis]
MVGSGTTDRSKEAVGMMALHEALRSVCLNTEWTYSVFWTIRPRPRVRGGNGCKVGDDNGSLMLMWEDGFCRGSLEEMEGEDLVRKAFSKMSIQLYNYGEGLMGKVASDKCHKWVFKEPTECEPNISNYWQSSFDALPSEWTDQFESGIQTIAVIQAGHGLLQLGSCKIIPEDLHFVLRMRHTFESLGYQSGFYLSQLFSSTRTGSPSSTMPLKQPTMPIRHPPPLFNWGPRPMPSVSSLLSSPNFQNSARLGMHHQSKDESQMFLHPHSSEARMDDHMMGAEHENDIKWPNGLTFFSALTGRSDDSRILFNPDNLGTKPEHNQHPLSLDGRTSNPNSDASSLHNNGSANPNDFLSLDGHADSVRKMDKFKRSLTLPVRMASSSNSSTSHDQHQNNPGEYRNEGGMYPDVMDRFLE